MTTPMTLIRQTVVCLRDEDEHDDDYAVDHYNSDDDAGGEEGETEATF